MHQRMKKAVNRLVFEEPFIGSLLPRLEIIEDNSQPTMCTNGGYIRYNRDFVDQLTDSYCMAIVAHEIFHCIMLHMFRKFTRDHPKWNVACDYAINPLVDELNSCNLPPPDHEFAPLMDTIRWPAGTAAEKIYEDLDDDEVPQSMTLDVVIVGGGNPDDPVEETQRVSAESDWKGAVAVAAQNAKQAGTMSGALEKMLERYLNPKLPWQQLLQAWATKVRTHVTNWQRRKRHYVPHGICMPGRKKIPTGEYVLAYDVSGSMSDEAVKESLTECAYIINDHNPERVILIEFDSEIKGVPKTFERDEELPTSIQILGRGGTDFRPVFRYIETELDESPDALIIFTDGWGPAPEIAPEYPVLWVMIETDSDLKMPFGEQIWTDP